MSIDWLNPLDAWFLQIETDTQPMHVGSLLVFDGPTPAYSDYCDHLGSRLDIVPRYRQRVQRPPLDLARPYWVDDPHFHLTYHVRHTAVPQPGGEVQLRALAGRIMSQRLDLGRPLWEMWLVEGLEGGRWSVISKVHHAMIDGVSGHELLELLLDRDEDPPPPVPSTWQPRPAPSRQDALVEAISWMVRLPIVAGKAVAGTVSKPKSALASGATTSSALLRVGRKASGSHGLLNGPIGPHRRWAWGRGDLAQVKAIKQAAGCTVNDVVLAAIAGGYRQYFIDRGEPVAQESVQSLVPVSVRGDDQRGRLGNQVSAMFANLPVDLADPLDRLRAVAAQMHELKASGEAIGVGSMVSAAEFVPPTLVTLAARMSSSVGQRLFDTVTTNIPGPQYPLYLLGRRLREMFPYIPIADGARISIGIVSYNGSLAFAATGDYDAVPDLDDLCRHIEAALDELTAAIGAGQPG